MVKSHQKSFRKNVRDANGSSEEDPSESILSHLYPHLPSISEEKWIELLQSDDEDNVQYKIRDESCKAAKKLEESQNLTNKAFSFVTMCCHMAWMKIIQMNFMRIDPGEKSSNFEVTWKADIEPLKSPHTNDFWPVPRNLVEEYFQRLLNLPCCSDSETKSKSESDKDRGDALLTAGLFPNTSEAELLSLKTKLQIPLSKYKSSEDYLAKWVSNQQSSFNCDWLKKEDTEQIIKLLGPEKRFIQNFDKFPDVMSDLAAAEQNEKEGINRNGASNNDLWHRNMEEHVSFILKLSESERKHFLPYLSLNNKCLEDSHHDVFYFAD